MIIVTATFATAAALAATALSFLLGCQSWEHRRRARRRLREAVRKSSARVAVIAPCKGLEVGLYDNLKRLFWQTYDDYELVFVVENDGDPARSIIDQLIAEHPSRAAQLVVAGMATFGCQKVCNLQAGIAAASEAATVLAFVDSDARPHAAWLARLVQRLGEPGVGVATGYRWFVPARFSLAAATLCSINATAASLYTPKTYQPVWGGSWAMRRDVYDRIELHQRWRGRLTDDLVATNAVRAAGLRVEFEPGCMITSPLETNWASVFAFLRRQYLIGRLYAPGWWGATLAATTLAVGGFWSGLIEAVIGAVQGANWTWAPAAACLAWYGVNLARAAIRRDLDRQYLPPLLQQGLAGVHRIDAWATPLVATVNWTAIVSTMTARRVRWREIQYELLPHGFARAVRPLNVPNADRRVAVGLQQVA